MPGLCSITSCSPFSPIRSSGLRRRSLQPFPILALPSARPPLTSIRTPLTASSPTAHAPHYTHSVRCLSPFPLGCLRLILGHSSIHPPLTLFIWRMRLHHPAISGLSRHLPGRSKHPERPELMRLIYDRKTAKLKSVYPLGATLRQLGSSPDDTPIPRARKTALQPLSGFLGSSLPSHQLISCFPICWEYINGPSLSRCLFSQSLLAYTLPSRSITLSLTHNG